MIGAEQSSIAVASNSRIWCLLGKYSTVRQKEKRGKYIQKLLQVESALWSL